MGLEARTGIEPVFDPSDAFSRVSHRTLIADRSEVYGAAQRD